MMKHVTESLVGRAGIIRMQGLSNDEIRNKHYPPFQVDLSSLMKRMNELEPMTLTQIFSGIFKGSMPRLYENENVDRDLPHHMFLADVLAVHVDPQYMDEKKKFHLNDAKPLVYSHGEYLGIGKKLGTFGYSVKKKKKKSGKKKQ